MNITLTEVKNSLQAYARSKGRPEYTHYAVKAVHFAIANGLDHPLKSLVSVTPKSITAQVSELKRQFCLVMMLSDLHGTALRQLKP